MNIYEHICNHAPGSASGYGTDRAAEAVGRHGGGVVGVGGGGASPGELFESLARAGVRFPFPSTGAPRP